MDPRAVERQMDEVVAVDGWVFASPTIDLFGIVVVPVHDGHCARKDLLSVIGEQGLVEGFGLVGGIAVDEGRCWSNIDRGPCDDDVLLVGLSRRSIDEAGWNSEGDIRDCW